MRFYAKPSIVLTALAVVLLLIITMPLPFGTPGIASEVEETEEQIIELSCIKIGGLTYLRFTDLIGGYKNEMVVPASMVRIKNSSRSPEGEIYLHSGYHHGYSAALPEKHWKMTSLQALHHCVTNAQKYDGS